jgi:hypothetical protein
MVEAVQILQTYLAQLQSLSQRANPDGAALQEQFLAAQQHFQQQVLPLGDRAVPSPSAQPMQPILTEMNRAFRLLAMDVAFLQAARHPLKAQQRQRQMADKLEQLVGFCAALETGWQ